MNEATENPIAAQADKTIAQIFAGVITNPAAFFREMPQQGGFANPLIFLLVSAFISGLVQAVLTLLGLEHGMMGYAAPILGPILSGIFGFLVAGVLYLIWNILGSKASYETAYRCMAYGAAIMPLMQLLNIVPYVGLVLGLAWQTYILIAASVQVHKISQMTATAVFGIIALLLAGMGISAQIAARHLQQSLQQMSQQMGQGANAQDPDQAMKNVGEMMKKLGNQMQNNSSGN